MLHADFIKSPFKSNRILINITTIKTVVHNIVINGKYTTKYLLIIKLIFVKMRVSECNLLTFFFIYLLKHLKIDFC